MNKVKIEKIRQFSRKLVREWGLLQLELDDKNETPLFWHALIEISRHNQISSSKLAQHLLISMPTMSRMVHDFINKGLVTIENGFDKREKFLSLSAKGEDRIQYINDFSNQKIRRALQYIPEEQHQTIFDALSVYADAMEQGRMMVEQIKVKRLTNSRTLRKQIVSFIESIQKDEFNIPITPEINASVLQAEKHFYFNGRCNFWYAEDGQGNIIGCIGLKKVNETTGELKKFFAAPTIRGAGLAQNLLTTLITNAKKLGFKTLYLGTVDVLKGAQKFYLKSGFELIEKSDLPKDFEVCHLDTLFFKMDI